MVPVGALTLLSEARHAGNDVSYGIANMVAPLVAMVPEGLVLLSSIAFAVSAIALARRHVLANELPAVEGLARTDVVCTDKTGTLTEREPVFDRLELAPGAQGTEDDVRAALGALATLEHVAQSDRSGACRGVTRAARVDGHDVRAVLIRAQVERGGLRRGGRVGPGRARRAARRIRTPGHRTRPPRVAS